LCTALSASIFLGCDDPAAKQDESYRAQLTGKWFSEYEDKLNNDHVRELYVLKPDGQFISHHQRTNPEGVATRQRYAGAWFVTAGLWKMRIEVMDGKSLVQADWGYSTCTIESFQPTGFSCKNNVDRWTRQVSKKPDDFEL
jgi:hypothetical protein